MFRIFLISSIVGIFCASAIYLLLSPAGWGWLLAAALWFILSYFLNKAVLFSLICLSVRVRYSPTTLKYIAKRLGDRVLAVDHDSDNGDLSFLDFKYREDVAQYGDIFVFIPIYGVFVLKGKK